MKPDKLDPHKVTAGVSPSDLVVALGSSWISPKNDEESPMSMTMQFVTTDGELIEMDVNTVQMPAIITGDTECVPRNEVADLWSAVQTGHCSPTSVSALSGCDIVERLQKRLKTTSRVKKKHEPRGYSKPTPWPQR
jgi:hypothetical protein